MDAQIGTAGAIAAAGRFEGVVAEWNGSYGFIHFSDGRRAYAHNSQCSGSSLVKGQAVSARIMDDPKNPGKWQAVSVERLPSVATTASTGRLEGVVAEWTGSPGYGFIHFSDGRRAYVHSSQCGGAALAKGQAVSGLIAEDPKNPGKWQAQSVVMIDLLSTNGSGLELLSGLSSVALPQQQQQLLQLQRHVRQLPRHEGIVTQWRDMGFGCIGIIKLTDGRLAYIQSPKLPGPPIVSGEAVSAIILDDPQTPGKLLAHDILRRFCNEDGIVIEWNQEEGFGFMKMDDGRRVYVPRTSLGGISDLIVGLQLRVATAQDVNTPDSWCVVELRGSPGSTSTAGGGDREGSGARGGVEVGSDIESSAAAAVQLPASCHQLRAVPHRAKLSVVAAGAVIGERSTGTVVEWDGMGLGLLLMEDGRHAEVCDTLKLHPGDIVSAVLVQNPQNSIKFCAHDLQKGPYLGDEGLVSEWHETGGYGFILLDDGRKCYIHRSAFGGSGALSVGARLKVITKPDVRNPGKWMASKVVSADETTLSRLHLADVSIGPLGGLGGVAGSGDPLQEIVGLAAEFHRGQVSGLPGLQSDNVTATLTNGTAGAVGISSLASLAPHETPFETSCAANLAAMLTTGLANVNGTAVVSAAFENAMHNGLSGPGQLAGLSNVATVPLPSPPAGLSVAAGLTDVTNGAGSVSPTVSAAHDPIMVHHDRLCGTSQFQCPSSLQASGMSLMSSRCPAVVDIGNAGAVGLPPNNGMAELLAAATQAAMQHPGVEMVEEQITKRQRVMIKKQ